MREILGDIWEHYDRGGWIVITTNGTVRKDGQAVMGRGVALQAKQRFPEIASALGYLLSLNGNVAQHVSGYRIISFPVKRSWWEKASLSLIETSSRLLVNLVDSIGLERIYMVRPGCGNGGLSWDIVKPVLKRCLDDRFIVVERIGGGGNG